MNSTEDVMFNYKCQGTCSTSIDLEIRDGIITYCKINDGCPGNTRAVATLVTGKKADEVAAALKGTPCRGASSCPDQLALAIESYPD